MPFRCAHFREDVPRLIETAKATPRADLRFQSEQSNGHVVVGGRDRGFISALPPETLLILDEAYCDTAPPGDHAADRRVQSAGRALSHVLEGVWTCRRPHRLRASAEQSLIEAFDKVRNHYGINRVGQLGARAALLDQDYLEDAVARIAAARTRIAAIAGEPMAFRRSHPRPASSPSTVAPMVHSRRACCKGLLERDVFVRKPVAKGLDHFIRISCGRDEDLDILAEALSDVLARVHA